jgi:plasmid stability protein
MKSIHIRNIDPSTLENLKRLARSHNRSLQGELRAILIRAARMAPWDGAEDELRLVTVNTGGKSNWNRDDIYGNQGR